MMHDDGAHAGGTPEGAYPQGYPPEQPPPAGYPEGYAPEQPPPAGFAPLEAGGSTDSMAAFAGPEDDLVLTHDDWDARRSRDSRHREPPRGGGGVGRLVMRIAVPLVFVGGVIALVVLVTQSGVLSGSANVSPTPSVSASPKIVKVYVVKKGDTLSAIALKYGVSMQDVLDLNPKLDANNLTVKTKIRIPAASP